MGTMRSDHEQGTQSGLVAGFLKPDAAASLRAPIAAARSANGTADPGTPAARGLYDPACDKDSAASASSPTSKAANPTKSSRMR